VLGPPSPHAFVGGESTPRTHARAHWRSSAFNGTLPTRAAIWLVEIDRKGNLGAPIKLRDATKSARDASSLPLSLQNDLKVSEVGEI